jgi:hypothetical protein
LEGARPGRAPSNRSLTASSTTSIRTSFHRREWSPGPDSGARRTRPRPSRKAAAFAAPNANAIPAPGNGAIRLLDKARCIAIMAQNDKRDSIGATDDELERWRRAAEDALQQLDWAIGYLHGIGKDPEARALAANRRVIRQRVLEQEAEPLPADE